MPCDVNRCSCYRSIGTVSSTKQGRLLEVRVIIRKENDPIQKSFLKLCGNLPTKVKLVSLFTVVTVFKMYRGKAHKNCFFSIQR